MDFIDYMLSKNLYFHGTEENVLTSYTVNGMEHRASLLLTKEGIEITTMTLTHRKVEATPKFQLFSNNNPTKTWVVNDDYNYDIHLKNRVISSVSRLKPNNSDMKMKFTNCVVYHRAVSDVRKYNATYTHNPIDMVDCIMKDY